MRFIPILLPLLSTFILSCSGDPEKEYIVKVKVLQLKESDIFDKDLVYDVIFDAEENNIDSLKYKSRELFLKGADYLKNKNNPAMAIDLFKSSILTFPDAKTYYELGNAFLEKSNGKKDLEVALQAYKVAEHLNFQPVSNIYYKQAIANHVIASYIPSDDRQTYLYRTMQNLKQAFKNGFFDTTALNKDPRINKITNQRDYQILLVESFLSESGQKPNTMFELFKRSFPSVTSGLEVSELEVDMENYKESINYDFAEFIPEMQNMEFSRDVSHDFFYVAKLAETPAYTALVYSSISFWGENMQPVHTTLATFTPQGEIISKKLISCQCSSEKIKTVKIENNSIHIKDYKRIWEMPIDQVSFEDNKIKDHELLAEAKFIIDASGRITDEEVPHNYSDSTVFTLK